MKKIFAFALCLAAVASAGAQKSVVDQAKKSAGKDLEGARALIQQAIANPESANDPYTYFVAGTIEWNAYKNAKNKLAINPNDEKVDKNAMAKQLVDGYNYFMKMMPLDQLPNEKGQVKPKYTGKVTGQILGNYDDFFNVGAIAYQDKKYYPDAYEAFMIHGDIPALPAFADKFTNFPDSLRTTSYFNAGLSAWAGDKVPEAAVAMKKAIDTGYDQPEAYIYEIAAWQRMAQADSTLQADADLAIREAAEAGFNKFGLTQPLFINNLINSMVSANKNEEALAKLNDLIDQYPDSPDLYSLRGFVNDRLGNDAGSEADYRKAAEMPNANFEILKVAANKLIRIGTAKVNETDRTNKAAWNAIRDNYFTPAKAMLEKAIEANKGQADSDINYLLDNVNYALDNYFN